MEYQGVSIFPNVFFVASLCSFICLQAVYQLFQELCKATWNGCPSYSLLTFISRFVIDFLSIRRVIIFSEIAIDDRHPPMVTFYTPKCCKSNDNSFPLYCATEKTYCARSRNHVRRLTSRSNGMPSKESLRAFVAVETVLRRGRMCQGSDEV